MPELIDARTAAGLIRDRDAVLVGGSGGGHAVPEAIIEALGGAFCRRRRAARSDPDQRGLARRLAGETGFNLLAEPGLARRVISAGFNNCPKIAALAQADRIEAWTLPQGTLSQLMRDMAAGRPGLLTATGLHTFVDPRHGGGQQSPCTREDLVELTDRRRRGVSALQGAAGERRADPRDHRGRARQPHDGARGVLRRELLDRDRGAAPGRHRDRPGRAARGRRHAARHARQGAGRGGRLRRRDARAAPDLPDRLQPGLCRRAARARCRDPRASRSTSAR